jgi:hypothetical protein
MIALWLLLSGCATVAKISLVATGNILLMADFGKPSKTFSCTLDGRTYKSQVEHLSPGSIVTIQGTLSEHSMYASTYSISEFLSLRPCHLVN